MRRSRKVTFVAISLAVAAFTSTIVSGCTQTVEQPEPDATIPTEPHGEMPEMPMAKVAEILGIEQNVLEDAFTQAQSEVQGTPSEESSPDLLMSRVAEILGIEQQEMEDAMAQVLGEMPGDASPPGPSDGGPGPRGPEDGPPPS
jgi:hypothetical protein